MTEGLVGVYISPAALSASRSGGREMEAREELGRVSCIISC